MFTKIKQVDIGSQVLLKVNGDLQFNDLVVEVEEDSSEGSLAIDSSFGRALLGRLQGERFFYSAFDGSLTKIEIIEIK